MAIDVADGNSAALGVKMLFDFNHGPDNPMRLHAQCALISTQAESPWCIPFGKAEADLS